MSFGHIYDSKTGVCTWPRCGAKVFDEVELDLCLGFGKRPTPTFDRGNIQRYNVIYEKVMDKAAPKEQRDTSYAKLKAIQLEHPGLREAAKAAREVKGYRGQH